MGCEEREARNVQRLGLGVPLCVIANGVDVPETLPKVTGAAAETGIGRGEKTALFLGRIHPKKGLPMLIEAWARVRPNGWVLQIAGPDEAGHRVQVKNAVLAAGLSEFVSFIGPIGGVSTAKSAKSSSLIASTAVMEGPT